MTRFVLDTDLFSMYLAGHPIVTARVLDVPAEHVAIAAVTVAELTQGWLAQVSRHSATGGPHLWWAYSRLVELPGKLTRVPILAYGQAEEAQFISWRRAGVRIGTNDLRIAATALCVGATLLTRSMSDFRRVPGVQPEDWSE